MAEVDDPAASDRMDGYTLDWLKDAKEAQIETFSMTVGPFLGREEIQQDGSSRTWLAIRIADQHLNATGFCHGGLLLTLADDTLGMNAYHAVDKRPVPTVSLQANFLKGVRKGDFLEATATDIYVTNSLVFVQGRAVVGSRQVASMNAIFKILG